MNQNAPRRRPWWTVSLTVAFVASIASAGLATPALSAQSPTPRDTLLGARDTGRGGGTPAPSVVRESAEPSPGLGVTAVSAPATGTGMARPDWLFTDPPRLRILADTGTHFYALSPDESDDVRAAIEHAIARMNFIARPIARRRLMRANHPSPLLTFSVRPDTLAVTFAGLNPIVTPLSGNVVPWVRGQTGETYAVHIAFVGDTLRQTIADDDGERENDFVFLDDGATVEMHVTLTADRLPAPLHYVEVFREIRTQPDRTPP